MFSALESCKALKKINIKKEKKQYK